MSETKLKPCPFCGGAAGEVQFGLQLPYVECSDCQSCTDGFESSDEAIKAWNTRPIEDDLYAALENCLFYVERNYAAGKEDLTGGAIGQARAALAKARGDSPC